MKKIDITPQELCERLFKGERFYDERGAELFYDGRFRRVYSGSVESVDINDCFNGDIYVKPHWTDNLSKENTIYCWVWEMYREDAFKADVFGIRPFDGLYETDDGTWTNAEPVKLEDACIWEGW